MKTLKEFKNLLSTTETVLVKNFFKGDQEVRPVLKVKSNSFYTGRKLTDEEFIEELTKSNPQFEYHNGEYYSPVLCDFQKASTMKFEGDKAIFLTHIDKKTGLMFPSTSYKEINIPWLEIEFI